MIAVTIIKSARIRLYAERFPRLTPIELAKLTGEAPKMVRAALEHSDGKPRRTR
jgi:hypothetical protein